MIQYDNFLLVEDDDSSGQGEIFSTDELLACFANIEGQLNAGILDNAYKAKLSRECAAKFVANI